MKCQKCNKREATMHMTKIINGHKAEYYLCSECASASQEYNEIKSKMDFGIGDFLSGMFSGGKHTPIVDTTTDVCPTCNMHYSEFLKRGKLGCGDCYSVFSGRLKRPIKQIHGSAEHIGKIPKRCGGELIFEKKISKLEADLNAAVLKQDFETAAKLRDEINEMKEKGGK